MPRQRSPYLSDTDFLTEVGASELRDTIVAYWRQRGAEVLVWIEQETKFVNAWRVKPCFVRSNLIDGMPAPDAYAKPGEPPSPSTPDERIAA